MFSGVSGLGNMEDLLSNPGHPNLEELKLFDQEKLSKRLKRTLYYAPHKNPMKDTLSLSLTKDAVETFRKAAPSSFGKLGHRYAARVARDACVSPCSLIMGMIYIRRLTECNPDYLQRMSSSELFLISMMVASKYLHDEGVEDEVFNEEWAASGLVNTDYVNELEAEFLKAIDWRLFVRRWEFLRALYDLEKHVAADEALTRGWLSYTDIACLLQSKDVVQTLKNLLELFCQILCACMLAYGGVVLVTVGSLVALETASNSLNSLSCNNSTSSDQNDLPPIILPLVPINGVGETNTPDLPACGNVVLTKDCTHEVSLAKCSRHVSMTKHLIGGDVYKKSSRPSQTSMTGNYLFPNNLTESTLQTLKQKDKLQACGIQSCGKSFERYKHYKSSIHHAK